MLFCDHVCNTSDKLLRDSIKGSKSLFLNKPREKRVQNFLLKLVSTQLWSNLMRPRFLGPPLNSVWSLENWDTLEKTFNATNQKKNNFVMVENES